MITKKAEAHLTVFDEERYLTLAQVADLLQVPLAYVYYLSSNGSLPGKVKLGPRTVRVDRKVLEEALTAQLEDD